MVDATYVCTMYMYRKKIASLEAVRLELEKDSKDHRVSDGCDEHHSLVMKLKFTTSQFSLQDYEKHRLEHRDCVSGSEYKR